MCGIIGYVGAHEAVPILLDGLRRLEYRGYDSSGVAVFRDGTIEVRRAVGKLSKLEQSLAANGLRGTIGVGHTRWATHGKPSEQNAHPHRSGSCVLVHNGIIENYLPLKQALQRDGFRFESETDTEVVAHLLQRYRREHPSLAAALRAATRDLQGSYAIVAMCEEEPQTLVAARSGCPLVFGRTPEAVLLASDVLAVLPHTREVVYVEDGDLAEIVGNDVRLTDAQGRVLGRGTTHIDWDAKAAEKSGYPHFMLKEIHEQPQTILDTLRGRYSLDTGLADLPDLQLAREHVTGAGHIWIVACGTSWHAGLVGKYLLEELARTPVQVDIASEFRYRDPLVDKRDLFITISQSGETADTLAAAREAKRRGARVLSIVNMVGSTLARESDDVLYTRCGPEIGVASTKAFIGQLTALYLLALHLAHLRGALSANDGRVWLERLVMLPAQVEHILRREAEIVAMAKRYQAKRHFLFLGRGINYPIALEGALKLKEISYIHAEGYAAGEMKHGPIALVDKDMPVVVLAPRDRLYDKTVNNLMEVKARQAPVLAFVSEGERDLGKVADAVFTVPDVPALLTPVLYTVALQLLAYH
ncbi:MAG: glutamine--fructose-6-phosphate transaminase (isomerizing), partial [Nitrospirales bacterium]